MAVQFILLSGGSGKRLWPLSNDVRSKQFIPIFYKGDGGYESMLQRVWRHMVSLYSRDNITIATAREQASAVQNQLGGDVSLCIEPTRRDTFPAMALAAAYLQEVKNIPSDEPVVVFPVDPYVERDYFEALGELGKRASVTEANLVLMGIEPTYPSEKYGYILLQMHNEGEHARDFRKVASFREKPDESMAVRYIEQGALWNGGIFACRLGYLLDKAHEQLEFTCYEDLRCHYQQQSKISFDYAVVEREKNIEVMRFSGTWKDLGTWNTLTEAMGTHLLGKGILDDTSINTHIVNELDVPIIAMGLNDVVVAASPEGVLVADKHHSSYLKPLAEQIHQRIMMAEKSWGSFRVLDIGEKSLTIKVTLLPGHKMHYHGHRRRKESWMVTSGEGYAIVDGQKIAVSSGSFIDLPQGCKHLLAADTRLEAVEVQIGNDISIEDKIRYDA